MKDNLIYIFLFVIFGLCAITLIILCNHTILLVDKNTKECYAIKGFNTVYKVDLKEIEEDIVSDFKAQRDGKL